MGKIKCALAEPSWLGIYFIFGWALFPSSIYCSENSSVLITEQCWNADSSILSFLPKAEKESGKEI